MTCEIFIFAGEQSGDLHGEKLIRTLKKQRPNLHLAGVGGPKMRSAGLDCIIPMEEFEVMGFIDVAKSLLKLLKLFRSVKREILNRNPKCIVFIDYPGFNLRMARAIRKANPGIKLIQYICPSVWAWGKNRIPLMANTLDELLVILPFEPNCFAHTKLPVTYVGNPIIKKVEQHSYRKDRINDKPLLSIFPGSRVKEIERNLPLQLKVAKKLSLPIAISYANVKLRYLIEKITNGAHSIELIPSQFSYEQMRSSKLAIATSGTVTLELALHHIPTVVTYAITPLDLFLAQRIFKIKLPYYCLVNIIGNQEIFPELFGPNLTEKNLYDNALSLLNAERERCLKKCEILEELIGNHDASLEASKSILSLVKID